MENNAAIAVRGLSLLPSIVLALAGVLAAPGDTRLPISAVGYGVSPGGRLRLSYDPPLYRDGVYRSLSPDAVTLRIEYDPTTPDGHPEGGAVSEVGLVVVGPDRGELHIRALPAAPFQDVTLPLELFPEGTSLIAVQLGPDHRAIARIALTRHPAAAHEVVFDAAGVCHVNGEPFFPIGIFHLWPGEALDGINAVRTGYLGMDALDWEGAVQEVVSAGFNCIVDWQGMIDLGGARARYDVADRHGLKALVHPVSLHGLSREMEALSDHPALLGWYGWDEPPPQVTPMLAQAYSDMRWLDPYHPLVAAAHTVDRVKASAPYRDVVMPDFYPGGGGQLTRVMRGADAVSAFARTPTVHWPVIQAFEISDAEGQIRLPRLSADAMRALVFMNLIRNARGVFYYAYWTSEMAKEPAGRGRVTPDYYARLYPDQWEAMRQINRQVKQLEPVLLEPARFAPLTDAGGSCIAGWKTVKGVAYLIAVNPHRETRDMRVALPGVGDNRAEAVFEGDHDIELQGDTLAQTLPPFAVCVYRIALAQEVQP